MMSEQEKQKEGMKSKRVFENEFVNGKDVYTFQLGTTHEYIRVFVNDEEIYNHELHMSWEPERSMILVPTPKGQLEIIYADIDKNRIYLSGLIDLTLQIKKPTSIR